ncbi:MAG: hypothetical protein PHE29_00310 [Tissierellia bacterium]|nr:hypothetical protein [Tissierellia bacterium]
MCCIDEPLPNKENNIKNSINTDFHEEIEEEEGMCVEAAVSLAESEDGLIDIDNEISSFSRLYDGSNNLNGNTLVENDIIELLDYNRTIIVNIEKRQDLIAKAQNSYNILQSHLSYLKSQNLELEKQIELISIEKETDVQAIRKLNEDIEFLQGEKINKIKELENEILSVRQSYDDEIKLLHSNFENFKLEKENEINNLHKEIERIQIEKEKDKKVLDEFQNMIKILEKIRGIFRKA